uniref:Reverse transcriptase/retrotransposon-derived protein RNase H-like domain-containing protein n=1 Tax=Amphimedon queenslandica TaxID=400682 RepID=A0A1X7VIT4_AMPQE
MPLALKGDAATIQQLMDSVTCCLDNIVLAILDNLIIFKTTFEEHLDQLLCRTLVLNSPDFNGPFILQTDASHRGVGAVLSQLDDSGQEHSVAYFSKNSFLENRST